MQILSRHRSTAAAPGAAPVSRAASIPGLAAAFAALLLAALFLVAVPAPAVAHDALGGSSPASGATVARAPGEVRLDFTNRPLGVGVEVKVTDAAGTVWSEGEAEVVDASVTQRLRAGAPAGAYTVVWRVVSSDSHPIEGTFGFTASAGAGGTEGSTTPAASPAASASPSSSLASGGAQIGTPEPGETATPSPAPAPARADVPWLIIVFAIVAVGLLGTLAYGARKRLREGQDS
ncbi:copper resistance CopC family protein [Sinomonas halotolerans]|uniref:Copper resistance CopC family protein n=1 Tax=Sinomonas halotolerans TaxID=1644133 RepID=A0ABU9WXG0_9MICC